MKARLLTVAVVLALVCGADWCCAAPSFRDSEQDIVRVSGDESHPCGRMGLGGSAAHKRSVENATTQTVTLRVVATSCPCVSTKLEPEALPPGEKGQVSVSTPVMPVSGPQAHWAIVEASVKNADGSAGESQRFRLAFSYQADLAFVVEPRELWPVVIRGDAVERLVYVRSSAMDALGIRNVKAVGEGISVIKKRRISVPAPARTGEEALAITLRVEGTGSNLHDGQLVFETDDDRFPQMKVPIQVRVKERWVCQPAGFALIFDRSGIPQSQSMAVSSREQTPCPAHTAELLDDSGKRYSEGGLTITLNCDKSSTQLVLRADPARLADSCGLAKIVLRSADGAALHTVPVAWIKPLPEPLSKPSEKAE